MSFGRVLSMHDMSDMVNPGVHLVTSPNRDPRTLIVLGVPRGGTTMIAGVLHHLGIYMGESGNRANLEDIPLADAVEAEDIDSVREVLRQRDASFDVWGWKRPSARKYLDLIEAEFRNPHFVMIWRDPFVAAQRRAIATGHDLAKTMRSTWKAQGRLVDFAQATSRPLLMLSYEKIVRRPDLGVGAVADFAGVTTTREAVEFISPDSNPYVDRLRQRAGGST